MPHFKILDLLLCIVDAISVKYRLHNYTLDVVFLVWSDGEMITILLRLITFHLIMCQSCGTKPTRLLSNFVQINCGANDSFNSELESSHSHCAVC